jgi:hypothetical protein
MVEAAGITVRGRHGRGAKAGFRDACVALPERFSLASKNPGDSRCSPRPCVKAWSNNGTLPIPPNQTRPTTTLVKTCTTSAVSGISCMFRCGCLIATTKELKMSRKYIDCREYPSEMNCSVTISADSDKELLEAAASTNIKTRRNCGPSWDSYSRKARHR